MQLADFGRLRLTVLRRGLWCNSYFMFIGVGVSCHISYSDVRYEFICKI